MTKNPQEAQVKYMQFKEVKENIDKLNEQIQQLKEQANNITSTMTDLEVINKAEKDTEIMVPVANGIFIRAKIEKPGEFVVNVGSETLVGKDLKSVEELMNTQKKELAFVQAKMVDDLDQMENEAISLQKELQGMVK